MTEQHKTATPPEMYIGDGVYAKFDGYGVWLYTSDGVTVTNEIYLEPSVFATLKNFVEKEIL